jgi:hypothetical protein
VNHEIIIALAKAGVQAGDGTIALESYPGLTRGSRGNDDKEAS